MTKMNSKELSLAVQAGGESRRMGRPKATVLFDGEPLIMRPLRRLSQMSDDIIVTTNDPSGLGFLENDPSFRRIRLVRDVLPVRGALGGMLTALEAAQCPFVAIVACDMMYPSKELFERELEIAIEGSYDAVVPLNERGWEPFHAVYRRDACIDAVRSAIGRGEMKAGCWLGDVSVYGVVRSEVHAIEPQGQMFLNANTPQELHDAEMKMHHILQPMAAE